MLIKNLPKIDEIFSRQRCLDPDLALKKSWIRIRFVLRGWIRFFLKGWIRFFLRGWIRIRSISGLIRNPAKHLRISFSRSRLQQAPPVALSTFSRNVCLKPKNINLTPKKLFPFFLWAASMPLRLIVNPISIYQSGVNLDRLADNRKTYQPTDQLDRPTDQATIQQKIMRVLIEVTLPITFTLFHRLNNNNIQTVAARKPVNSTPGRGNIIKFNHKNNKFSIISAN